MNAATFDMRSMLEVAGFRVRGTTRADCIHCAGHSAGTVAFTREVAFCHRCKWTANMLILASQLGFVQGDPTVASAFREEARKRARLDAEIRPFETWQDAKIREISNRYRSLSRAAVLANTILARFPDCEPAWGALARFYHAEAQLLAAFDWLMFARASVWLEKDSTPVEVFDTWRSHAA